MSFRYRQSSAGASRRTKPGSPSILTSAVSSIPIKRAASLLTVSAGRVTDGKTTNFDNSDPRSATPEEIGAPGFSSCELS